MSAEPSVSGSRVIGFWHTVRLLLRVARRRSSGRMHRQQELLAHRSGSRANTLEMISVIAIWGLMAALNGGAAYILFESVSIVQRMDVRQDGKLLVDSYFVVSLRDIEDAGSEFEKEHTQTRLERAFEFEAKRRVDNYGETRDEAERDGP